MWQGSWVNSVISSRLKAILTQTTPLSFSFTFSPPSADPPPHSTPCLHLTEGYNLSDCAAHVTQSVCARTQTYDTDTILEKWQKRQIRWMTLSSPPPKILTAFQCKCKSKHLQLFGQTHRHPLLFFFKQRAMPVWCGVDLMRPCIIYYDAHPLLETKPNKGINSGIFLVQSEAGCLTIMRNLLNLDWFTGGQKWKCKVIRRYRASRHLLSRR